LGIAVSVIDSSIVNLALPDITRDLGASASASVWVVNAYQLATLGTAAAVRAAWASGSATAAST
jgi:MFS family permease